MAKFKGQPQETALYAAEILFKVMKKFDYIHHQINSDINGLLATMMEEVEVFLLKRDLDNI